MNDDTIPYVKKIVYKKQIKCNQTYNAFSQSSLHTMTRLEIANSQAYDAPHTSISPSTMMYPLTLLLKQGIEVGYLALQ